MRDAKLIWSNPAGWIGFKPARDGFVALCIGERGKEGRRVAEFDGVEFTSQENAAAFAKHVFAMLKGEPK